MATYNDMLQANNPTLQAYSDAARTTGLQGNIRRAERRARGRTALLTRGQRRGSGMALDLTGTPNFASAEQINPTAVSRGKRAAAYAPMKSIYEFGKTSIGRIYKKQRSRTDYLGLQEGAKIGDAGFKRLFKGKNYTPVKRRLAPRSGVNKRRGKEARNLIREYQSYVAQYKKQRAQDLA